MGRILRTFSAIVALGLATSNAHAELRPVDLERSQLTVFVYKSGLFSAFADNHTVKAPLASGSISQAGTLQIEIAVKSADLKVLDPDLAASKRAEVQARMLGPDVLDAATYPDITFVSTQIDTAGTDRWTVTGRLTIRGQTRTVSFPASRTNGRYVGDVQIKQREFGIEPIRVAGGTVKVKDELKIQFEIVPAAP
jgi:polyisoprenoid-binding protein YceI